MNHADKITWMKDYATRNNVVLELEGSVGFGRECVGISRSETYPDYQWYNDDYEPQANEIEFLPTDAYHKHPCVAVLGRGEVAESQLYEWLKWFDDNGYEVVTAKSDKPINHPIELLMGKDKTHRMVKVDHK